MKPLKDAGHKWEEGKVRMERDGALNQLKLMYFTFASFIDIYDLVNTRPKDLCKCEALTDT